MDFLQYGFDNMVTIGLSGCDIHVRRITEKQAKPDEVTLGKIC